MPNETNLPNLLDTDELDTKLRTPTASLEAWRSQGSGPEFMRLGRKVFYAEHDVVVSVHAKEASDNAEHCLEASANHARSAVGLLGEEIDDILVEMSNESVW